MFKKVFESALGIDVLKSEIKTLEELNRISEAIIEQDQKIIDTGDQIIKNSEQMISILASQVESLKNIIGTLLTGERKIGEHYSFLVIDDEGNIRYDTQEDLGTSFDNSKYNDGNYFLYAAQAEKMVKMFSLLLESKGLKIENIEESNRRRK